MIFQSHKFYINDFLCYLFMNEKAIHLNMFSPFKKQEFRKYI